MKARRKLYSCIYDSLMESEERRRERLRRRNQHDRVRRAAESAQQRKAWLTRRRVRDRTHRASPAGESFGSQERAISVSDSRPENESSGVGASLSAETTSKKA